MKMTMIMWMTMMMISMRRRRTRTNIFKMRGQQGLNWVSRLSDINYDDDFKVKTMMVMMLMTMMVMSMTMTTITFTMGGQQGGHGVSSSAATSPWNSLLLTSVAQHTCRVVDDGDDDDNIKF